jgi:hypothetical protein
MVTFIVVGAVAFALGFIIGGLVVKNNIKKIDSTVAAVQQVSTDIKKV